MIHLCVCTEPWPVAFCCAGSFCYYGLRSLLTLFLRDSLGYSDPQSVAIYSYFTSFAYFTPLLGGYLADSYLGKYKVRRGG